MTKWLQAAQQANGSMTKLTKPTKPPPRHLDNRVLSVLSVLSEWSVEDWQASFDEHAGIAEYDGGQNRQEADSTAIESCITEWLNRHPEPSDSDKCAWCKQADTAGHAIVPFSTVGLGHTWLHPECWEEWHQHRRELARQALERLGIRASVPDELRRGSNIVSE